MRGPLAFVGGGELTGGCTFEPTLLERSGAAEVLVLPTGAAYERPDRVVAAAEARFQALGATARGLDVLRRPDAFDEANAAEVAAARFLYLLGESPMHLRSVLKGSPVWEALRQAWEGGAVLAASGGGAMALCDPMVDPRGGALTVGLGLLEHVSVIPEVDLWSEDTVHRTRVLSPPQLVMVGIPQATALVRDPDGTWWSDGVGQVRVWVGGEPGTIEDLPC